MKRYDILLFDADNTLFDFSRCEYEAFRETARAFSEDMRALGGAQATADAIVRFLGDKRESC